MNEKNNSAFLLSQGGTITGIVSATDHGDLTSTLMEWLQDEATEMVIRVPMEIARKALFEPTWNVLEARALSV